MSVPPTPHPGSAARILLPAPVRSVQGHRAGIVTRTTAGAVDLVVALLCVGAGYLGWSAFIFVLNPPSFHFPTPGFAILFTCLLGTLTTYLTLAWTITGRTIGNRLLGLRVVSDGGGRVGFSRAILRALLCVFVPIVLFWVIISRENRSVPDILLRTSVIYDWTAGRGAGSEPGELHPAAG
ncbi:hypothetical protein N865_03280 [Intrasporangium oryzae NRRL B-24470]|uniref:RDD domain-containing protein n=1 Tax=Intrasporangium oryzae NRRL B-24470 TaxID=1386089 RepID=W9GC67_9MICO|nr:RDD family protein [Intrasporangium oryzae]EWT02822.1 hypothetical protein N865_03280 [Intrasporangium oryzae NRRL B-24470]